MTETVLPSVNDYEITFQDFFTSDFISLGSGDFCRVTFDGIGSSELRESVYDVSGGDGIQFGIEYQGVTTWNIVGAIHTGASKNVLGDSGLAWNAYSQLARAWTQYPERLEPRSVVPLYFKRPGREQMVVYGRPNRIDPITTQSYAGFITYTATFRQSDPVFYSAIEDSVNVGFSEATPSGIQINPLTSAFYLPFRTSLSVPDSRDFDNLGDVSTNPIIKIYGSITNPVLTYLDDTGTVVWQIRLATTLIEDEVVTIDTRHWARSVVSTTNLSLAGTYKGTRLANIVLRPGAGLLQFSGSNGGANTMCEIFYRKGWYSV